MFSSIKMFLRNFSSNVPISERFKCNKDQIVSCIAKRCSSLRLQIISVCNLTEMTFRSYLSAITSCMFPQKGVSLQSKWLTAAKKLLWLFYNMMNMCLFNDKHHFVKGSLEILSFELAAIDNLNIFNQTIVWYFFSLTDWRYGAVLCKLTPFLQGISVCASVNTLAAIAIDRY